MPMLCDTNALRDIHQANVNLGMRITNLWLENLNRTRALAVKAADERAASTQKTVAAIAAATDPAALIPLQADLLREQITQSSNFWQHFLAETHSNQTAILDDLRAAAQGWQANCADAVDRLAGNLPMAEVCKHWAGATGLAYQPLSAATQQMLDLAKAGFNFLPPSESKPATAAKRKATPSDSGG